MLDYFNKQLTKKEKRSVARYMSQYNNLDAIIQSKQMALEPSTTSSIREINVQETNTNTSQAETYLERSLEVDELLLAKRRMDIAYSRLKPIQKLIWNENFILGRRDFEIYYEPKNEITKKKYYEEKNELMVIVFECLNLGTK